jgi:hypothetical protein
MKRFALLFLALFLLTGCGNTAIQPTEITPIPSTKTATPIQTSILTPTLTSLPTVTFTPSLPEAIEFEFDEAIPENFVAVVKTTVNQAYWYYVNLGCSPEFHKVVVESRETAGNFGLDGINIGWDDLKTISLNMDVRISHEMAHVMCEIQFTKDVDTGGELEWLFEGTANYFADEERLVNTGKLAGVPGTIIDHQVGMSEWLISSNFCNYPFKSVEKDIPPLGTGALSIKFPDFAGVGEVAAMLLAKTNPNGRDALLDYYKNFANDSSDTAFQKAFGLTKDDFYQQFQNECEHGFPTFYRDIPTPIPPEGTVRIQGKVTAEDGSNISSRYFVVPCRLIVDPNFINIENCASGSRIDPDGNFTIDLPLGHYYISVNSTDGGEALGWYSIDGLVNEPTCATVIKTDKDQSISIVINPENIKAC